MAYPMEQSKSRVVIPKQRVVLALGGNAFASPNQPLTMAGQMRFAREALGHLTPLLGCETELLISHGNGPQVGHILTRVEEALGKAYAVPLEVCVAESEGELGYVLEQALYNVLAERGIERPIASLLTQVVVGADDPAFARPTKPIGVFYDYQQAEALVRRGFHVVEDAGRGYRRVVPSPRPLEIVEFAVMRQLLELGAIVIAAGGGGIPVVRRDGRLEGVEAVIDKDLTAALAADRLDAQRLVILTDVPCAYRHYRAACQTPIRVTTASEVSQFLAEGHFAPGSMRPKMEAAARFVSRSGRQAIITNPASLGSALRGEAGTIVESSGSDRNRPHS
jgi:carbamate kinase